MQRAILEVHTHEFAKALVDYNIAVQNFERGRTKSGVIVLPNQLSRFSQFLDERGEDRCSLANNLADEVRTVSPKDEKEAIQIFELAGKLSTSLARIDDLNNAMLTWKFAEKQLALIHNNSSYRERLNTMRKSIK